MRSNSTKPCRTSMWWNSLIILKTKKTSTYSWSSAVGRWDYRAVCILCAWVFLRLYGSTRLYQFYSFILLWPVLMYRALSQTPTCMTAASNFMCVFVHVKQWCTAPLTDAGLTVHSLFCFCSPWPTFGKQDTHSQNQKFGITSDRSYPASSTSTAEESCTEISN